MDKIVALISKIFIIIFVAVDIIELLRTSDKKTKDPFIQRLTKAVAVAGLLIYLYFFFTYGFNLTIKLFKIENLSRFGGVCGIIAVLFGRYLINRDSIGKQLGAKRNSRCLLRLMFYPAMSVVIYIFLFFVIVLIRKQIPT